MSIASSIKVIQDMYFTNGSSIILPDLDSNGALWRITVRSGIVVLEPHNEEAKIINRETKIDSVIENSVDL